MKRVRFIALCLPLACAGRTSGGHPRIPSAPHARVTAPAQPLAPPAPLVPQAAHWSIRAFPHASVSIALPANGVELSARDLAQVQALLAVGVRVNGERGPTYVLLVYPISNPLSGASIEQRLYLLPYLLSDLGPDASRSPVDLDGLHGVEFVTKTDSWFQRTRVFATAHNVVALMVKATVSNQTTDDSARLFFESLQWYDDQP